MLQRRALDIISQMPEGARMALFAVILVAGVIFVGIIDPQAVR